ncbi:MAG: class I SAM-dependent methyltransferase [Candidatus Eisenbacteria bacterium]
MAGYYDDRLSAARLRRCYEIAPPAARAYLESEIRFVAGRVGAGDRVLELGCGYGRVLLRLHGRARFVWGIDTSLSSLRLARNLLGAGSSCGVAAMDAIHLGFADHSFDCVFCIQNGISAFHVDPEALVREAVRVARPGGHVLVSSYAERFWQGRLEWFEAQAAHGLLGEIDHAATGNGVIVCKDGFHATTFGAGDFRRLGQAVGIEPVIVEVDGSSLFCEFILPSAGGSRRTLR